MSPKTLTIKALKTSISPAKRFHVAFSPKMATLTPTATTGSRAPNMAVGVDQIHWIANTIKSTDITTVTKENRLINPKVSREGRMKLPILILMR